MSALDDYQTNIVTKLETAIPDLMQVEPHYGTFNVDEIMRRITNSPSAFVALPTIKPGGVYSDGRISFIAETMVIIISAHTGHGPDGDAAIVTRRIMEQVLKLSMWNAYGVGMPPTELEGNELHWDKLDPMGMAMCVASWAQEILLSPDDPFLSRQSRMPDFSFPTVPATAPDTVKTNETATPAGPDVRGFFDKGVIR